MEAYVQQFIELLLKTTPTQWMLAFFILLVTDVAWARYTVATHNSDNPHQASRWAVALFLLGGLAVVGYTTNPVLLLPSALGAYAGTYIGVWMKKKIPTNGS